MPVVKTLQTRIVTASSAVTSGLDPVRSQQLYNLIESFFLINPAPNDQQIHMLAAALGLDKETFEAAIYELFGDVLKDETAELGEDDEDATEVEAEDAEGTEGDAPAFIDVLQEDGEDVDITVSDPTAPVVKVVPTEIVDASDEIGRLAEHDGIPDREALGEPDPLKDAADADGEVDEEPFLNKKDGYAD